MKPKPTAAVSKGADVEHWPDGRRPAGASATRESPGNRWLTGGICLFLAIAVWVVFGQTARYEFVNFDDDAYVYENPFIRSGLNQETIAAAFTRFQASNWHPLTSLSHAMDYQLYGLNAGGHHITNVLLHALTAILLFLNLRKMTQTLWPSAFVAAVFAVHPLRVESVAWVAERKDILSGLFFMLTLGAYVGYVRHPRSVLRYLSVLVLFALGLMSKPMLVTLPFVLLLLDYWPLRRFATTSSRFGPVPRALIVEKLPMLALSAVSAVITLLAQHGAIRTTEEFPLTSRLGNAAVSYVVYLKQLVWPVGLAPFYPWPPTGVPADQVVWSVLLLAVISAAAFWWRINRPYFPVGWLWYLGMLVPVIGLVPAGSQAHADRYTYLPEIGLYLLTTWLVLDLSRTWQHRRQVLGVAATAMIIGLMAGARWQTTYWRNSETLWTRTLLCTTNNALAEGNLGNDFFHKGNLDEAMTHCRRALAIKPDYPDALNCLGFALFEKGQLDEAVVRFQEALRLQPSFAAAHNNLGMVFLQGGRLDEAIAQFKAALATDPDLSETHNNLGACLAQTGQEEAAITHYQRAIALKPDYAGACNNLAWIRAASAHPTLRNGSQAVELAERADQLSHSGNPLILRTLAAAYAESGRFPDAIATAEKALPLAASQGNAALVNALHSEIGQYQASHSFQSD